MPNVRKEERFRNSVGARVDVKDYGQGTLSFYGYVDFAKNTKLCGVTLDDPLGKNNGTVGGRQYFSCDDKHGIFLPLEDVALLTGEASLSVRRQSSARPSVVTGMVTNPDGRSAPTLPHTASPVRIPSASSMRTYTPSKTSRATSASPPKASSSTPSRATAATPRRASSTAMLSNARSPSSTSLSRAASTASRSSLGSSSPSQRQASARRSLSTSSSKTGSTGPKTTGSQSMSTSLSSLPPGGAQGTALAASGNRLSSSSTDPIPTSPGGRAAMQDIARSSVAQLTRSVSIVSAQSSERPQSPSTASQSSHSAKGERTTQLIEKLQSKISATNISTSPPPASRTPSGQASSSTLRRSSSSSSVITPTISSCPVCGKAVYIVEQIEVNGVKFHKSCFKCQTCQKPQTAGSYISEGNRVWCKAHYAQRNTVIERMIRT